MTARPGTGHAPSDEHHVVAGLLRRAGRVLLVHRCPQRRWYPDCWDLPGGHVEPGEAPTAALRRELREELGIDAVVAAPVFARVHAADYRMDVWLVDRWRGEPTNRAPLEHDALGWLTARDLSGRTLADPRLPALVRAALDGRG